MSEGLKMRGEHQISFRCSCRRRLLWMLSQEQAFAPSLFPVSRSNGENKSALDRYRGEKERHIAILAKRTSAKQRPPFA